MRSVETLKQRWADGHFTTDQHFSSAVKNAEAIGALAAADSLLDTDQLISDLTSHE